MSPLSALFSLRGRAPSSEMEWKIPGINAFHVHIGYLRSYWCVYLPTLVNIGFQDGQKISIRFFYKIKLILPKKCISTNSIQSVRIIVLPFYHIHVLLFY